MAVAAFDGDSEFGVDAFAHRTGCYGAGRLIGEVGQDTVPMVFQHRDERLPVQTSVLSWLRAIHSCNCVAAVRSVRANAVSKIAVALPSAYDRFGPTPIFSEVVRNATAGLAFLGFKSVRPAAKIVHHRTQPTSACSLVQATLVELGSFASKCVRHFAQFSLATWKRRVTDWLLGSIARHAAKYAGLHVGAVRDTAARCGPATGTPPDIFLPAASSRPFDTAQDLWLRIRNQIGQNRGVGLVSFCRLISSRPMLWISSSGPSSLWIDLLRLRLQATKEPLYPLVTQSGDPVRDDPFHRLGSSRCPQLLGHILGGAFDRQVRTCSSKR